MLKQCKPFGCALALIFNLLFSFSPKHLSIISLIARAPNCTCSGFNIQPQQLHNHEILFRFVSCQNLILEKRHLVFLWVGLVMQFLFRLTSLSMLLFWMQAKRKKTKSCEDRSRFYILVTWHENL